MSAPKRRRLQVHEVSPAFAAGLKAGDPLLAHLARAVFSEDVLRSLATQEFLDDALAWAAAQGVVMYREPGLKAQPSTLPFALTPTPVAADVYAEAVALGPSFHGMMDRISCDLLWLRAALERASGVDAITGQLLGICDRVYGSGKRQYSQDIRLHILRNDFMIDTAQGGRGSALKQIECNMIAASFSTHAQDLTAIHRYLLGKYVPRTCGEISEPAQLASLLDQLLPESPAAASLAGALAAAHAAYASRWTAALGQRAVLFVSDVAESNELDHRKIEIALFRDHGVVALRRSLAALGSQSATLRAPLARSGSDGTQHHALIVDGFEVSVAYFRSGYWACQFDPSADCWAAREAIEASEAVKCPSAPAQLAGMKKVQQLLCRAEELRRFVPDACEADRLKRTFASQADPSDDSPDAKAAVSAASERPEAWVMKPQVEGSGDLVFGADIRQALQTRPREELAEFILMERIRPPVTPSVVYGAAEEGAAAKAVVRPSVGELGIFGVFLADGGDVLENRVAGHLLRSKARDTNQGGVFVGNAVVDTPLLLPPELFWRHVSP